MARPDLAEVLLRFGAAYRATHALPRGADKVWRAIVACRTPALGGYVETCSCCGTTRHVYRSCRNRHCPRCQTRAKEAWIAARRREVLPVPYFHLVFTLPHALHPLIAAAPRLLYENLFAAVSATLSEFAANPRHLGGASAFSLILHTWQQDLSRHVHLHALVAGGALSSEGTWRFPKKGFLFPVKALSRVFRGKFVAGLSSAFGKQALPGWLDARAWRRLKSALHAHEWVVYAKSPLGGPTAVLEYLGRYTHRVAISSERIMAIEAGDVLFRMRPQPESGTRRVGSCPARRSSSASCSMSCPPGSSASGITACCLQRARRRPWPRRGPRSMCRRPTPRSSSPSRPSWGASGALQRFAVPAAVRLGR